MLPLCMPPVDQLVRNLTYKEGLERLALLSIKERTKTDLSTVYRVKKKI